MIYKIFALRRFGILVKSSNVAMMPEYMLPSVWAILMVQGLVKTLKKFKAIVESTFELVRRPLLSAITRAPVVYSVGYLIEDRSYSVFPNGIVGFGVFSE